MNDGSRPPLVSFVVPCHRLAHLLRDCVQSILMQDFDDFEVLIMDDCSPDDTPQVAASIDDPRVRHIRHERNLGHLRNYNAGIGLARGRYVWLISADDRLWRPYVLSRFVASLEMHPAATFAFCPVRKFCDDADAGLYGSIGADDVVCRGDDMFMRLLGGNIVPAPAALARRSAYEDVGRFPLDLPFAGDWYMWAAFAARGDVVYHAEPMVQYRLHDLNMTKSYLSRASAIVRDDIEVIWRMREMALQSGRDTLIEASRRALTAKYAYHLGQGAVEGAADGLTAAAFEQSLDAHETTDRERASIRGAAYAALGDAHVDSDCVPEAREAYVRALSPGALSRGARARIVAKLALLALGPAGARLRRTLSPGRIAAR